VAADPIERAAARVWTMSGELEDVFLEPKMLGSTRAEITKLVSQP
jgi:hypothetical protein